MKKAKRWTAALLGAVMLFTMGGCAAKAQPQTRGTQPDASGQDNEADEYVYEPQYMTLGEDAYYMSDVVFGQGNVLHYMAMDQEEKCGLYTMDLGDQKTTVRSYDLENGYKISGLYKGNEGNLFLMLIAAKQSEESGTAGKMILQTISPADGSVLSSVDVTAVLGKDTGLSIGKVVTDKEGYYYISSEKKLYVMKPDGEPFFEVALEDYIDNLFVLKTGQIVVGSISDGFKLERVDLGQKGLTPLECRISLDYGTYQEGETTDLLFTKDSALYQYNLKEEEPSRILSWLDCNVESTFIVSVKMLDDGRIAVLSQDWSGGTSVELTLLTRKKRSQVKEKTVITYGALYLPYYTDTDIIAFNKQSDKYRIEVKQYGDDTMGYGDRMTLMNNDILSGKGPDIIELNNTPYTLEELVSKGILEDLTAYLDNDQELKREDFVENVLKAYERDGRLYAILPCFGISTLIGKASQAGDKGSWTLEDIMKFASSLPENTELISDSTSSSMLELLCSLNMDQFIDKATGVCDFTGEEFKKILEFAATFPAETTEMTNGPDNLTKINTGQAVLLEDVVKSVSMYQLYEYIFGEPVEFVGFPTAGTQSGSRITPGGTLVGMNAASANKEGVWEFIRFNLTEERQEKVVYGDGGFPSRKEALEKQFQADMTPDYYVDESGNQKEAVKAVWATEHFTVDVFAASSQQVDAVKKMIEKAGSPNNTDTQVVQIIYEESKAYFSGQKSCEDVASLIQNRVQTYVNEKR